MIQKGRQKRARPVFFGFSCLPQLQPSSSAASPCLWFRCGRRRFLASISAAAPTQPTLLKVGRAAVANLTSLGSRADQNHTTTARKMVVVRLLATISAYTTMYVATASPSNAETNHDPKDHQDISKTLCAPTEASPCAGCLGLVLAFCVGPTVGCTFPAKHGTHYKAR